VERTVTRVLLVEDDEQDYVITRELLAQAPGQHFALQWVDRIVHGLAALAAGAVDVILLDLSLPDSQGWATFQKIRDRAPDIPIILLTGLDDETVGLKALQEGAQDYLFKGTTDSSLLVRSIRYSMERKRVELSLKQYQEHLEELVADRTTELSWANTQLQHEISVRRQTEEELKEALRRLQQHDKAQSDFVSNVSHELKTPLASMTYAIENLLKGVLGDLQDRMRSYLLMMKEDCSRLTGTINDILDMSRIDARRLQLNLVRIPFDHLARRATEYLRVHAESKGLKLRIDSMGRIGFVLCDARRMERVIFNLVNNAIKFTEAGGEIEVCVTAEANQDAFVSLAVIDNGIGIPAEYLGRITERYFRIGEHISGSGLGLSLCKELVEMHNGQMVVDSPPPGRSRGTRVLVRLPAAESPAVLAVDGNPETLGTLQAKLVGRGYRVIPCHDCNEAVQFIEQQQPDAVIVDCTIAEGQEFGIIGHIRANPRIHYIPILAMTSPETGQAQCEILRGLQIPFVPKDLAIEDLLIQLEKTIADNHRHLI
jgi:signal transduction histidine kinase